MTISKYIDGAITKSSWIRKMFENGARLKAEHGAEKVFDFSLGNPSLKSPESFHQVLRDTVAESVHGDHGYMPNIGRIDVRKAVAEYLTGEQGTPVTENEVIMTCGAAGALNVIFKTLLDPGDEVITPAPCFVEYNFYAQNHGGILKTAPTMPDFHLDIGAIADTITPRTKIILINSPNNPTGQIYPKEALNELNAILTEKQKSFNRDIYLVSDEPYRKITFDGIDVPSLFEAYDNSIVCTSYSKDLSIPGERIGFLAVNPKAGLKSKLIDGMALANRILGYVNAPALMQRVVGKLQGVSVDISEYQKKRDLLCNGLAEGGYEFTVPAGAFYLFPKTPVPDDVEFVRALQDELILVVPGSGFMGPGYFRIAFCVDDETIVNAMPGFKRVMEKFK